MISSSIQTLLGDSVGNPVELMAPPTNINSGEIVQLTKNLRNHRSLKQVQNQEGNNLIIDKDSTIDVDKRLLKTFGNHIYTQET